MAITPVTPVSTAKPSGPGAGNAVKATVAAIVQGDVPEKTPEFWDGLTEKQWSKAYKARATTLKASEDGKARVREVNDKIKTALKKATGWLSFDHIPQGRHFSKVFDNQLEELIVQLLANAEPLNYGYGLDNLPDMPVTPVEVVSDVPGTGIETPPCAPRLAQPQNSRLMSDILAKLSTPPQPARQRLWKSERKPQPPSFQTPGSPKRPNGEIEPLSPRKPRAPAKEVLSFAIGTSVETVPVAPVMVIEDDSTTSGEDPPESPGTPKKGSSLQDKLLPSGTSPSSAIDVESATEEEGRRARVLACGRAYEDKLRQIDNLYASAPAQHKSLLSLVRRIMWTFKQRAIQDGVWDVFGYPLRLDLPYGARSRDLFPGSWISAFLTPASVPVDFVRGLDDGHVHADNGTTGWLRENHIETLFEAARPEARNATHYLKRDQVRLLCPEHLERLMRVEFVEEDRDGLLNQVKSLPGLGFPLQISHDTQRFIMFVNPAGNHWFTVRIALPVDRSPKGLITVFNSSGNSNKWFKYFKQYATILTLRAMLDPPQDGHTSPFRIIDQWDIHNHIDMPQQTSDDCGLFTLNALIKLARGDVISAKTTQDGFWLRQAYLGYFAALVTKASRVDLKTELEGDQDNGDQGNGDQGNGDQGNGDDGEGEGEGKDTDAYKKDLQQKLAKLSFQH
jgi:hypothetical protein